ncbi:MAG: carbohydrate-binding protein [Pseudomonadota bacterium]
MTTPAPILTLPGTTIEAIEDATIIDHAPIWALSEGSLALTVIPDAVSGFQGVLSKDAKDFGTGGHFGIWIDDGAVYVRLQSDDTSYALRGGQIEAGQQHEIAVSFGSGGLSLYIDGGVVARNSYAGGLQGNLEPVSLGASQWASRVESAGPLTHLFTGEIGEVRLFDTQLDAAEFDAVFTSAGTVGDDEGNDSPPPPPLPADTQVFEAEDFDATVGVGVFTQGGNRQIGSTQDGEWVRYDGIDFGNDPETAKTLTLRLSSGSGGGTVELRTGTPEGPLLASYTTGNTGGWASYDDVALDLGFVTGVQDLHFVFRGGPRSIMDIDRFEIANTGADPDPVAVVQVFEAEDFDATEGVDVFTQGGNRQIGSTQNGEWVRYDAVDFGATADAVQTLELTLSSGSGGGTVEVRTGAPDGSLLASYTTGNTGGWARYDSVALDLGSVTGLQDLHFVFRGGASSIMDIDRFRLITTPADGPPPNQPPEPWRPFFEETALDEGRVIAYSLPAVFRDVDGDPITFSVLEGPDFVAIENDPFPVLRFRPEDGDDGVYTVSVVASDGLATSEPWTFQLTINDAITVDSDNAAPFVFIPLTGQEVPEGESRTIDVQHLFRDPDGDALSYSLVVAPDFVTIDGAVVTVAPDFDDAGTYEVGVVASDGQASSEPASITYEVLNVPTPPPAQAVSYDLVATADGLTSDRAGGYIWDGVVSVSGMIRSGLPGEVVYSTQFNSFGYGVAGPGSRWDGQIDFYDDNGGESEAIIFAFDRPATDVTLHVGMLGATEGGGGLSETGIWTSFAADGTELATGLIGPELSALGPGVKVANTYGSYPIEIASPALSRLLVEATQFGHGAGSSATRSYGENSSDFNVQGLDFTLDDTYLI